MDRKPLCANGEPGEAHGADAGERRAKEDEQGEGRN